ncbi:hypothetical protein BT93_A0732 [Corymbia citriodora subsp. variegata]|nr:hypothetical protein BT93_A0732 [Corymbia citriodora subsp. variegata]
MTSQKEAFMAKWTKPLTNELVSLLVAEVKKGNRTTCTYNKIGWNNIHVKFNKRTGLHFSMVQLKNMVNKLKRQYGSFKKLLSQSGFGWDNVNNTVVVADQSVWETHIKISLYFEWAKFKNDGFPQYPDLCIAFSDAYTTGECAKGNIEKVVLSLEGDDNGVDSGGGNGGGDVIGDLEELDEHPVDDEAFTPNVTSTLDYQKHKLNKTPNFKRRKSSTYDVSSTCKAIHKIMKFKTSQSTSDFVTSDVLSSVDPYSIGAVVAILTDMPKLKQGLYKKAVNQSCLNATWREAFIISLPERRRGLLESL